MKLERVFSRRAISRKLCDRRANSLVPWRLSGRSALRLPLPTRSVDQLPHRSGDRAMKDEPDQQRRHDHGEYREADFCALLIEMLEDIAGRARGIDDPGDLVPRDNRHRRKDAYARAPANGVERRLVMPGDTHAQGAAEASLQRL